MFSNLQLYQISLDISPIDCDRLWQFLSEDERSRSDRFKKEYLKRNFIAARGNLRIILAQWLNCEPREIYFQYGDRGKPYLQTSQTTRNSQEIYFNLAHSQNMAIYAVSRDRDVGIDLEFMNPKCDFEGIAKRYFLPSEQQVIQYLGDRDRNLAIQAFYRAWTLKEAYGKATGAGIANLLESLEVAPLLTSPIGEILEISGWQLKLISTELMVDSSYAAALCIRK
jgi:4'-phosphopantetheinyl transferase